MKNITRHQGIFEVIRREKSSVNGNPRYLCCIGGFTCYTAPDSSLAYKVTNHNGKECVATIGAYYGKPTLNTLESIQ